MKKLLIFSMFIVSLISYSQNGNISGIIIDNISKKPIPYASITCKNIQNKIITGAITNKKGKFSINGLPLQKLLIEIQFIGYQKTHKNITLSSKKSKIHMGTIILSEVTTELDEIVVESEKTKIVQKIDRKVINVGNDLTASGANALQMLQNIPTLDVDVSSGTISMRGDSNVRILVNGKPSGLSNDQLLKQIRSNTVKQVELITNPSAKYTPEGMSGIINLVLKKNTKIGFNGSFTLGVEHGKHTRPDFYIDANYKTGSVNFYGNYNYYFGKTATIFSYDRIDIDLFQNLDFLNKFKGHNFKIGADITLGKKDLLSAYTSQGFNPSSLLTKTIISENNLQAANTSYFSDYGLRDEAYNLDYIHIFDDKGQQLELELNHTVNGEPEKATNFDFLDPNSIFNFESDITHVRKLWLANLDYTKPIKKGKIEVGLEYRELDIENNIATSQQIQISPTTIQPIGSTNLSYKRNIFSGYINLNQSFGKFSFQTGLRMEQLNLTALFTNPLQGNSNIKQDIFSLYPSAFLTYQLTDNDSFQLSYSRRVNRPSIYHVYSILEWYSPLTISVGNPNLRQQFTNSIEFNYTKNFDKGHLTLGSFYRRSNDVIGALIQVDPLNPNRQSRTFTNYDYANNFGMEVSANYKPTKWWSISPSSETYMQQSQSFINNKIENVTNVYIKARIRNSFKVTKKLRLQFDGIHRGKNVNVQQTRKPFTYFNVAARLTLFNGNGSLNIRGNDIFDAINYEIIANNPFPQNLNYDLEADLFYIGFTYNFGSGKNSARERKYRDSREAQKGLF